MSDGGKTDETSNGEMGWGQEYRLRCGKLKKGMYISYGWSGKRNRDTFCSGEGGNGEISHQVAICLLVEEWRGKEGASILECGKVKYAVGNALGS